MASMSNAVATHLAAVPAAAAAAAGLRMESWESAIRSSPSSLLMGSQKKNSALVSIRGSTFVARASASEQESQIWNVAKGAAVAAAVSLMLSASPVEAREGRAFNKYIPNNTATEAAAVDLAPKISQPVVLTKGPNPMKKSFATATRGPGDKAGKTESRDGSLPVKDTLPGNNKPYRQGTLPGIIDRIYNNFKAAGEGRDAGVGIRAQ